MKQRTKSILLVVMAVVFLPFPTTIAHKAVIRFVDTSNAPVSGVKIHQSWATYGLWGGGSADRVTDNNGVAQFPIRFAYGKIALRVLGRLLTFVAVHSSYGASISVEFNLQTPTRAVFTPPTFKQLEPFATSGQYSDSAGRYYFPQINGGEQWISITGDFLHDADDIVITVERRPK